MGSATRLQVLLQLNAMGTTARKMVAVAVAAAITSTFSITATGFSLFPGGHLGVIMTASPRPAEKGFIGPQRGGSYPSSMAMVGWMDAEAGADFDTQTQDPRYNGRTHSLPWQFHSDRELFVSRTCVGARVFANCIRVIVGDSRTLRERERKRRGPGRGGLSLPYSPFAA